MLPDATRLHIGGAWHAGGDRATAAVVNPATESEVARVVLAGADDVDHAVEAARQAFPEFSRSSRSARLDWLRAISEGMEKRQGDLARAVSEEMGAPADLAGGAQAESGPQHFGEMLRVLEDFPFEELQGTTLLRHEPVGVCALITPWNWPVNQIATKIAPALAAGCTMILKPSEMAPLSATIIADIIDSAGLPAGVFNLLHGDGQIAGAALCAHPDVDMISFTGSTRAGVAISEAAAPGIKRVTLELGGKSACIILDDADLGEAVSAAVLSVMVNTGQSCNAAARLLVPETVQDEAAAIAVRAARSLKVGWPDADMGPVANRRQYKRVLSMIAQSVDEGAELLTGGTRRPDGLSAGYFVAPTIFGRVAPGMRIAREEVFGPVVTISAYRDADQAIRLANDSEYGLSGAVWSGDRARAAAVAAQMRTGMVHVNGAPLDTAAPFGGYKMSGNGREWGRHGLREFLEVKSVYGAGDAC